MINLIPSVVTHNLVGLEAHLAAAAPYFNEAHIDFGDGIFVSHRTIQPKDLKDLQTPLKLEAHLMVQDPASFLPSLPKNFFRRVILHQEVGSALAGSLSLAKGLGYEVGLAINPESSIDAAIDWWKDFDFLQLMAVTPGGYGGTFHPLVLEKISFLKEHGYFGKLQIDGAVTPQTALTLVRAGANSLVVGHHLFGSEDSPTLDKIGEKLEELKTALATS